MWIKHDDEANRNDWKVWFRSDLYVALGPRWNLLYFVQVGTVASRFVSMAQWLETMSLLATIFPSLFREEVENPRWAGHDDVLNHICELVLEWTAIAGEFSESMNQWLNLLYVIHMTWYSYWRCTSHDSAHEVHHVTTNPWLNQPICRVTLTSHFSAGVAG